VLVAVGMVVTPAAAGAQPSVAVPAPQPIAPACADAPADRFPDVSGVHAEAIDCIGWWGITQGTSDGRYLPNANVRRDQMASFIARTIVNSGGTLPASPPDAFDDDDGNTHELAINQLAAVGIVTGVSRDRYNPSGNVSRAQMASFLARAWQYRAGRPLPGGGPYFTDVRGGVHFANINRIAAAGITAGVGDGRYDPNGFVSRAQMGTFLARTLAKLMVDDVADYPPANPVPLPGDGVDGCVDLNTASLEDLERIVHIGSDRAQQIIDLRPWSSVDELIRIDGIGPARLADIQNEGLACIV
jgi:hypothetical protein